MIVSRQRKTQRDGEGLGIGNYNFKQVREFKYLEFVTTESNAEQSENRGRISAVNRCYYELLPIL